MTPSDLSILIPTRNRPEILRRTLSELQTGGFGEHPLFIYDDASDDSKPIADVVANWQGARLIRGDKRGGQAKGRNRLLKAIESEFALLLDDDSWPEDRKSLLTTVQQMELDGIGVATFQYRSLADNRFSVPVGTGREAVTNFLGGASVFHVASVASVGGYREEFVYGYEEPELAMRLILAGVKIECFPNVVVAHNHFETPGENRNHREYHYLYARNGILMSSLNMPVLCGMPHGLVRSFRRSLYHRSYFGAKFVGTLFGIADTFRYWNLRTPCTWQQAFRWIRREM